MRYLLPLILASVLSSPAAADHCPGCPKAPALVPVVPVVPYVVPAAPAYRVRVMERTVVRERIVTGERRPVRRAMGRVFGFMGCR